ncbi:MAG: tyrosine--tRNA ligase, partial [Bacteroidales bacterium]|nr:tyrosine--tRNA ligase [Bacteroidales bacterium]
KFGKTESGNIWLDPTKTSAYEFFQFWMNCSDEDSKKLIRVFTLLDENNIKQLEIEHEQAPHLRILQKALAKDLTIKVHSESDYNMALEASEILFGKGTASTLSSLSESMFLSVFKGVPTFYIAKEEIEKGINAVDLLTEKAAVFTSKGEIRRLIKENGLSINKEKVTGEIEITQENLLNQKYILVQKGKKNYFVIIAQ